MQSNIPLCVFNYLPSNQFDKIFPVNKNLLNSYKEYFKSLESKYIKYYNKDTRKKLTSIENILKETEPLFKDFKFNLKNEDIFFPTAYGQIINRILRYNKITIFKYEIKPTTNYFQLNSILKYLNYPRGFILTVSKEVSNLSKSLFKSILNCVNEKDNIIDFTINFGNNYLGYAKNAKKISFCYRDNISYDPKLLNDYKKIFEEVFRKDSSMLWLNYEDYNTLFNSEENNKTKYDKLEFYFSFPENKNEEFEQCLGNLSKRLKADYLRITLFKCFNFSIVVKLISSINPSELMLTPYHDLEKKDGDELISGVKDICDFTKFNIINISSFDEDLLTSFIKTQKKLTMLRICGNLSESLMEAILTCYIDEKNDLKQIKSISLNGKILMCESWKDIICQILKIPGLEEFHIDCFFEDREYMRDIVEAFYNCKTMKSFAVRNSVRGVKDEFVSVYKNYLYEQDLDRDEVSAKLKLYKLI